MEPNNSTAIEIHGTTLHTPDAVIIDCWEDRAAGLLSRAAGVALMPYINADERQGREYDRVMERLEYGDPSLPPAPTPRYVYTVDGKEAWPVKAVQREQSAIFLNDGTPTGRIYMRSVGDVKRLLGQS
jgi:hypothetical protein